MPRLDKSKIVMLLTNGYHEHEFWFPYYRFLEEGAKVFVAGPQKGPIYGEGLHGKNGLKADIEYTVEQVSEIDFDLLYLPGGIFSPLELRAHRPTLDLIKKTMKKNILIASICHAIWILVSADVIKGRKVVCPPDINADIENAGGILMEKECVMDGNLITAVYYRYLPQQFRILLPALIENTKKQN